MSKYISNFTKDYNTIISDASYVLNDTLWVNIKMQAKGATLANNPLLKIHLPNKILDSQLGYYYPSTSFKPRYAMKVVNYTIRPASNISSGALFVIVGKIKLGDPQ